MDGANVRAVAKSRKSKKRRQKVPKPVLDFGNVSKASRQPVDKGEASKSLKNAQEQPSIAVDKISRVEGGGDNKSTQKRANELKTNVLARNQLSIGTKEGPYKNWFRGRWPTANTETCSSTSV